MILSVKGLAFTYPSRPVLQDISFAVCPGEFLAVLGVNGAGKSTLLKCINRVLQPYSGAVFIHDQEAGKLSGREMAQRIGYVPQRQESADMTVFDAVLLGRKPYIQWEASPHDLEITRKVLKMLELESYALRYLQELSGGEEQKVVIARALAQEPDLLLLDEPTSSLDLKNQLEVARIIQDVVKKQHMGVVVAMHDLNLAIRFADKFLLLKNGAIFAAGGLDSVPVKIKEFEDVSVVIPV